MFQKIVVNLINIYQKYLSGILVFLFGHSCRFTPTCSEYSKIAFKKYGVFKGFYLALKRIIKCNPLSRVSFDPVP